MTRIDSTTGKHHDTSAHFVWIGDRTRQPNGGHVEFCRGIENPIGIKCGPTLKSEELIKLCNILNPNNEKGRITLISRFGHDNVEKFLPRLIKVVPPPATIPSSTAARVAFNASSMRNLRFFNSVSVGAPTLITATPPASLAMRSFNFSLS